MISSWKEINSIPSRGNFLSNESRISFDREAKERERE
jgi:hypothetical protein